VIGRFKQLYRRFGAVLVIATACLSAAAADQSAGPASGSAAGDYRFHLARADIDLGLAAREAGQGTPRHADVIEGMTEYVQPSLFALLALMTLSLGAIYWWRSRSLQAELLVRQQAEQATRASEQAYRALVEAAPFPVIISCARTGRIRFLNGRSEEYFGISRESILGRPIAEFCQDVETRDRLASRLSQNGKLTDIELRLHDAQGQPFWGLVSASLVDFEGRPGVFVALNDITERKQLEARLEHMVNTDALTSLASRRRILEVLEQEHGRATRYESPLAILAVDIDHFKQINDGHGHDAGDEALRAFANVVRSGLRSHDSAGRLGGEEFMVVLPETGPDEALQVAERLRATVEDLAVCIDKKVIRLTVSIGIASLQTCGTVEELMKAADHALYAAKDAGRNRVVFQTCKLH